MSDTTCPYCDSIRVKPTGDQALAGYKMATEHLCSACEKTFWFEMPEMPRFIFVNKTGQDWKIFAEGDDEVNPRVVKAQEVFHYRFKEIRSEGAVTVTVGPESNEMTILSGAGGLLHQYEQLKAKAQKKEENSK